MYICICNGITDRQIKMAVANGAVRSVSDVYRCMQCKPECGRCAPTVVELMRQPVGSVFLPPLPVASSHAAPAMTVYPDDCRTANSLPTTTVTFAEAAE